VPEIDNGWLPARNRGPPDTEICYEHRRRRRLLSQPSLFAARLATRPRGGNSYRRAKGGCEKLPEDGAAGAGRNSSVSVPSPGARRLEGWRSRKNGGRPAPAQPGALRPVCRAGGQRARGATSPPAQVRPPRSAGTVLYRRGRGALRMTHAVFRPSYARLVYRPKRPTNQSPTLSSALEPTPGLADRLRRAQGHGGFR